MGMDYVQNSAATKSNNIKRDYNLVNHVISTDLKKKSKKDLLLELTGKRKTMVEGAAFMLKHKTLKFDDLERALNSLNQANNSYSLTAVEAALQTQIDVIREMDQRDMSKEDKSLCLYTLQNMIFALSDYHLENGQKNDYVPKILQDQYQMLLKGSTLNLDWDRLNNSAYSNQFNNKANPTLAKWKFLDDKLIQENMKKMALYQSIHDENLVENLQQPGKAEPAVTVEANPGVKNWGTVELNKISDAEINQILNNALTKFNTKSVKNDSRELFNFVKDAVVDPNADEYAVNYPILHEVVLSTMHKIVEVGNNQQKKAMMEQNQVEGRTL